MLSCVTVDVRFHNFDKILAKKLRAVKVAQVNFLFETLKEIFPPQLPGRKYVTESSLYIILWYCRPCLTELWSS